MDDLTEKVRQGLMTPQYAKTIRARRRREKAERETALAVDDNLTELVRDGTILPIAAIKIRADRALKAKKEAEREAERQRWLERQEEERRMSPAWAEFVLAHSPGLGGSVLEGTMTLREAVRTIEKDTCQFGCQIHFPLSPAEEEALITLMGEREDGLDREQAALVLEWAPTRVVNYEALAQIRERMLSDGGAP
jgi:hypothetical protein